MAYGNTILSLNPDGQRLREVESALRENNFEVISVATPLQARFEIEMGRCGVFLTSYITPPAIYEDLAALFRRSCPAGIVVFLSQETGERMADADIVISERNEPQSIVNMLRSNQKINTA